MIPKPPPLTFYRVVMVRDGREIVPADVTIEIDFTMLASLLGTDAINNKGKKATLCDGAIKVRATRQTRAAK